MLAAFHRDLIAAPFLGSRRLVLREDSEHVQSSLRDHAAKISSSSSFHLSQKMHLDERGHSLVWTDEKARAARQSGVRFSPSPNSEKYKKYIFCARRYTTAISTKVICWLSGEGTIHRKAPKL